MHPNLTLRAYTGIGDAETQSPEGCGNPIPGGMRKPNPRGDAETPSPGMTRKPGDLPQVCPRPKNIQRPATRDTLHGLRPNLRQRDPKDRNVPIPPNVSDKGANTNRCVRKKKEKKTNMRVHIPGIVQGFLVQGFCADAQRSVNAIPRPSDNGSIGQTEFVVLSLQTRWAVLCWATTVLLFFFRVCGHTSAVL